MKSLWTGKGPYGYNTSETARMSSNKDEKLHYAAMLLLNYGGGSMQRTNLNKALFYLDLCWMLERGETFTGVTYVAITHGPVVDGYRERLILPLLASGQVHEREVFHRAGVVAKPLTLCGAVPDPEDQRLELVARHVADWVASRNAVDLSELSHANLGWKTAIERGNGTAIDMTLALEQLAEPDPWLDEPLTPEEQKRINERLSGEFVRLE